MGADRKLNIDVSEELAGDIDRAVASGDFCSADDVVAEALQSWKLLREAEIERLREMWRVGIESGEPRPFTQEVIDDIIERGRARAEARKTA